MMQQPVFQQEQSGNQGQQQQQMLLCPVRLVYETQILVQPGDQIRPNQTILINPQNQPPWAQNRVQNPVIYVQNVPNNFIPQVQQHLEQNQMFLQQNYGFPQVIQHPMLTQNQEQIRTLQVGNVPANIQSQMPTNLPQLMPSESMIAHNYGHVQINPGINIQNAAQNQITNVPINANNRQVQNVPKSVNEIPNNTPVSKPLEVSAQNYRQLVNQHLVNQMNMRAQMQPTIAMIQMPNMIQKAPNIEHNQQQQQINPMQQQVIVSASNAAQHTFASTSTNTQMEPRKTVPIVQKAVHSMSNTTMNHAPKNQSYSYRPIQPRPQQYRPNVATPAMTVQPNMNIQIQSNPNITDMTRIPAPNVVNTSTNYQKTDISNTQFNRKRKSESPDELRRKLTIVPASQPVTTANSMTVKRIESPIVSQAMSVNKVNTHEIGVNTTPMVKMPPKNNRSMIQINPIIDQNIKIKEELAKPIPPAPAPAVIPPVAPAVIQSVAPAVIPPVAPAVIQSVAPAVIPPVAPAVIPPVAPAVIQSVAPAVIPPVAPAVIQSVAPAVIQSVAPAVIPPVASTVIPSAAPVVISSAPTVVPPAAPAVIPSITSALTLPVASALIPPVVPAVNQSVSPAIIPATTAVHIPANIPHSNPLPILNATHPQASNKQTVNTTQGEKDKLIRNTVFTQARFGRVLTDKDDVPVKINTVPKLPAKLDQEKVKVKPNVGIVKTENVPHQFQVPQVKKEPSARTEVKEEVPKTPEVTEDKPVLIERNAEEKMLSDSMHRLKGTEPNELKFKNERDYILTHVLDGFVIQESNVAFPIRLPLKEKTLAINAEAKKNIKTEESKDIKADKVPDLSHLNLTENERLKDDENMEVVQEGNPFTDVKHCAVKSWTVDQLAVHLAKFDWADTIAVLQEHEIDGESLFLVSKSQLVNIGVKEEHADVICEFVRH